MAKTHAVPLVKRAWTTRSPMVADLALDVIVPPLTALVVWAVAGLAVCALAAALGPSPKVAPWLFGGGPGGTRGLRSPRVGSLRHRGPGSLRPPSRSRVRVLEDHPGIPAGAAPAAPLGADRARGDEW